MNRESPIVPLSQAGRATVEGDLVMLDGPDGVAVTMTAQAAKETGESLVAAAEAALGAHRSGAV